MAFAMAGGHTRDAVMTESRVWPRRKPLIAAALRRHNAEDLRRLLDSVARADRMAKGALKGDAWEELASLLVALAGPKRVGAAA